MFTNVGAGDFATDFIEDSRVHGITEGCGGSVVGVDLQYCPRQTLTKDTAATMLLKARYGMGYAPPTASLSAFTDVDIDDAGIYGDGDFAADWIVELANQGYTEGCGTNAYCPQAALTTAGFAKLLVKVFRLIP